MLTTAVPPLGREQTDVTRRVVTRDVARCLMTRDVARCLVTRDVARCLVTRDAILRFRLDVCIRLQETVATLALEQASCTMQRQYLSLV